MSIQPRCKSCVHFTPAEGGYCMFFHAPMDSDALVCSFYLPDERMKVIA